ncbi:hypothetical protein AOLI_G00282840 [Acnodon oligacanthus]
MDGRLTAQRKLAQVLASSRVDEVIDQASHRAPKASTKFAREAEDMEELWTCINDAIRDCTLDIIIVH